MTVALTKNGAVASETNAKKPRVSKSFEREKIRIDIDLHDDAREIIAALRDCRDQLQRECDSLMTCVELNERRFSFHQTGLFLDSISMKDSAVRKLLQTASGLVEQSRLRFEIKSIMVLHMREVEVYLHHFIQIALSLKDDHKVDRAKPSRMKNGLPLNYKLP